MTKPSQPTKTIRSPFDLAFEQLVYGVVLTMEERSPGFIQDVLRTATGSCRFSVHTDVAFMDVAATVRFLAVRGGYFRPE